LFFTQTTNRGCGSVGVIAQDAFDLEFSCPNAVGFVPMKFSLTYRTSASSMVAVPFSFLHLPEPYSLRNRRLSRIPLPEAMASTRKMRPMMVNDMPNQNPI
jgi:hypothetical protein